jgi:hypothetical protein
MPAPTESEIKAVLTKASIKEAIKDVLVTGTNALTENRNPGEREAILKVDETVTPPVTVAGELPDTVDDMVDGIAEGLETVLAEKLAAIWDTWQKAQSVAVVTPPLVVTIPITSPPGTPSAGTATGTVTGPGALP